MLTILLAVVAYVLFIFVVFCILKAGSDADDYMERQYQEFKTLNKLDE